MGALTYVRQEKGTRAVQKGTQPAKGNVLSSLTLTDRLARAAAGGAWGHKEGVETKSS